MLTVTAGAVLGSVPTSTPEAGADHRPDDGIVVIAHRGSSGIAPENTIAAVRAAVRQGAEQIENDVQRTADGALVIVHDPTLARTTNVEEVFPDRSPWRVGDFTLAEIKRLDAGSWFAPEFTGERVPTLSEWLRAVGPHRGMLLEAKAPELYPGIAEQLRHTLLGSREFTAALRRGDAVMQSFNHEWLREFDAVAPGVPVGLLFAGGPPSRDVLADAAGWAEQANPALGDVTPEIIDLIHSFGLTTHVWTVNDGQGMRRAINWGADGVITNYPQVLTGILSS
nr:glycerophosphodiester phosphodiesterase family protein [Kribbella sandramycini]